MKNTCAFLLSAALAVNSAGCVDDFPDGEDLSAEELGEAQQQIVVGTNDTNSLIDNAVVWLSTGCTGTLVGRNLVLTAAHCGYYNDAYFTGGWTQLPTPTTVFFGADRSNFDQYTAQATSISAPPLPTGGPGWNEDIVLLRLTRFVPTSVATPRPVYLDRPAPLRRYALAVPSIYQIGYGGNRDRRYMTGGDYEDWMTTGSSWTMNGFSYTPDTLANGTRNNQNIEGGDSGGPMTLNRKSGPIMGVLSHWNPYGIATYGPGGDGRPSVRDWLRRRLPTQRADFEIVEIQPNGCSGAGGSPLVRVTVRNKGAVRARAWVDMFIASSSAPTNGDFADPGMFRMSNVLAPDGTQDLSFAITNGFTSGWIDVLLDTPSHLIELDEHNNWGARRLYVADCTL